MEKYRVEKVYHTKGTFHQELDLRGLNKSACARYKRFCVYRLKPMFRVGTTIKLYPISNPLSSAYKAYSYKIGDKHFVDVQMVPVTDNGLEHFYDDMSWFDAVRLKYDVMCALHDRNIQPTLNAANNLRLLLFNPANTIKTL